NGEAAQLQRGGAGLDVLRARCHQQDLEHVVVARHRPHDLEVEADFLDRIGDVVARLQLDLRLEVVLCEVVGHRDQLGDHGRAGHRADRVPGLAARAGNGAADRLADRFGVRDVLVHHGIGRKRLDGVALHPITITRPRQLQELDRCRADVDRYFGRLAFCDQPHNFPLYSRALTRTTCPGALNSGLCAPWQLPATGAATAVSPRTPMPTPAPQAPPLYWKCPMA